MSVVPKLTAGRSRSGRQGVAAVMIGLLALLGVVPAASAAAAITMTTPYPAIAVAPGTSPNFDITITTSAAGRVDLAVSKVPASWAAVLRGGGFTIDGIESDGSTGTKVTLNVTVPDDATGTQRIEVKGTTSSGASATLALDVRVTPNAAGDVTMTTATPQLKGASNASFSFTLSLMNETADDLPFSVAATGPAGWTVTAQVGSQAQAASVIVKAGSTENVSVSAKAADAAPAGTYPIGIDATSGSRTAHADLSVEITGSYKLTLSTLDGRLNTNANAGAVTDLTLVVTNTGTADVEGTAMSATAPDGWTVTFDTPTVTVPAGGSTQVVAHMTASAEAIAGDYVSTFKATAPVANASTDIRVTVETSPLWGAIGIALIALVLLGLWWTFRRFGRR